MILNLETIKIINSLNDLKNKDDFSIILETAISKNKINIFNEIAFFSKFSVKTFSILKRIGPNDESYPKLESEWKINLEKIISLLKVILVEFESEEKIRIENKYFQNTQESFLNLTFLISDFSKYKNLLLDKKL